MIAHVHPASHPLTGTIDPPSSKNFTTRYVLASALADGRSVVHRPAVQDDAIAAVQCLRRMGALITALDRNGLETPFDLDHATEIDRLEIHGFGTQPRLLGDPAEPLNPGNAGAVFRLLLAVSALLPEARWATNHHDSLGRRPNIDLIEALRQLGVQVDANGTDGCLPMTVRGGLDRMREHITTGRERLQLPPHEPYPVSISGEISSQYTSALLFLLPLLGTPIEVHATGRLKSLAAVETTRNVLARAGITIESSTERDIHLVRGGQTYSAQRWETNGDWPATSAILAAAAVVPGSRIGVQRLFHDEQGEKECVPFFERMGCETIWHGAADGPQTLEFASPPNAPLASAAVNGDLCTDAVLAMMAAALFADDDSRFVQIRNLQFKECDRVREPLDELRAVWRTGPSSIPPERALWYEPEDDPDIIHVRGEPEGFEGGIQVNGRGDHRVIMMLSIVALRCRKGLRIQGAEHVSKSFPGWFATLRQMGVKVDELTD